MLDRDGGRGGPREEFVVDFGGRVRRRAFRRRLPFGRGAVLRVGGRDHIVGVADLSVTGAYLVTRVPLGAGETHTLALLLLPMVQLRLRVEVVRVSLGTPESDSHPRGAAVRFVEMDEATHALLEEFVRRPSRSRR